MSNTRNVHDNDSDFNEYENDENSYKCANAAVDNDCVSNTRDSVSSHF